MNPTFRAFFLISLGIVSTAYSGIEKPLPIDKVPDKILTAGKQVLSDFAISSANTEEEEDGTVVYELQGTATVIISRKFDIVTEETVLEKETRDVEIDLLEDGEFEEYEVVLNQKDVPYAVRKSISNRYPNCEFVLFEASYTSDHQIIQYEVVIKSGNEQLDLELDALGNNIRLSDS